MSNIAERLRALRIAHGLSQEDVAARVGVTQQALQAIESGRTRHPRRLLALARLFGVDPGWLETGEGPASPAPTSETAAPAATGAGDAPAPTPAATWPRDVPVLGTAAGSLTGAIQIDQGAPIDFVRRPPGIAAARTVYAIYVVGESMSPRYEAGDPIFVHPDKPARIGDYVVVQIANHAAGAVEAYVKRLARRTADTLTLAQFNPAATIEIPTANVRAVHRVLTPAELFGL